MESRIPIIFDDAWGGAIASSVVAHIATSTPKEYTASASDMHNYSEEVIGSPAPVTGNGRIFASDAPGLGVEPNFDVLGDPVACYRI